MSEPGKKSAVPAPHLKFFDIMRPGKAPASATSRPMIVGHKPQVQDSTLTDKSAPAADKLPAATEHKLMGAHDEVSVASITQNPAETEPVEPFTTPAAPTQTAQPAAPLTKPETPTQPTPEPVQPEAPVAEIPAAPHESVATADPEPASIAQPVVSFHHKRAGKRPWKWLAVLVIILVLAAVALDLFLDAGTITMTGIPHTHFFK